MDERLARALWPALGVTTIAVLGIKWLTGIALMPLLLVALVIMALAFGLAIRLQRAVRRPQ